MPSKNPKVTDRRSSANGKPKRSAVPAPFEPGDRQFVLDTFTQTETQIKKTGDAATRVKLLADLTAIRTKFKALPASKITRERCERYMAEVVKLSRDMV